MKTMKMIIALPAMASAAALAHSHETVMSVPMFEFKDDCGKKSHIRVKPGAKAMLQVDNVPGAGVVPFDAFETVLKDGFLSTDCVKDYMYYRGDKHGNNKFDYKLGPVSNVSIVHYADTVAKEDQQEMTQKVCFEFCRTVPNMGFFGIVNGRNCYCTPYFTPMESDSSQCDAVCEGETQLMCGGNSKSSIFTMHMCASTQDDLNARSQQAFELSSHIKHLSGVATDLSDTLQNSGEMVQSMFGNVGDSGASNLAQDAKVWAGNLAHSSEDTAKIGGELATLAGGQDKLGTKGNVSWTDPAVVTQAEHIMDDIDETLAQGEAASDVLEAQIASTSLEEGKVHSGAAAEYYPVMYFVDKEYKDMPATCTGDLVGKPMVGSKDACASACDNHIHSCVGYQYFGAGKDDSSFCHLFSGFKSGFYYTGCKAEEKVPEKGPPGFLQVKRTHFDATCWAKLSKFEGTTLKPDGSGKCKQCFKELTKADRCPW